MFGQMMSEYVMMHTLALERGLTRNAENQKAKEWGTRGSVAAGGWQGLTLVHFSAQLKHVLWDRGACRICLGGVQEVSGGIKQYRGVSGCILCQKRLMLS